MTVNILGFLALEAASFLMAAMCYGFLAAGATGAIPAGFLCFVMASLAQFGAFQTISRRSDR